MKLLTVEDVAGILRCAKSTVYALLDSGKLPSYNVGPNGGAKRVSEADLEAYLESCRHEGKRSPARSTSRLRHLKV
jgi:excisionase family DNA binding protein